MKAYDAEALSQSLIDLENGNNECWTPAEFKDYLLENQKVIEAEPVRYGHWTIDLHHYFKDEEFGDLIFYANICCSECGKKITSIYGDTIENPCVSYEDYWSINPLDLYKEQYNKIKKMLSLVTLENYCPNCGRKMIKEDDDD